MDFEKLLEEHRVTLYRYWIARSEKNEEDAEKEFKDELTRQFYDLFNFSSNNNIYWTLCDFPVFKNYYNFIKSTNTVTNKSEDNFDFELSRELDRVLNTIVHDQVVLYDIPLFFLSPGQKIFLVEIAAKKLEFLEDFKYSSQNPYPLIFRDSESFRKFEFLKNNMGEKSADLSYIYHQMWSERGDSEIICNSTVYISFLLDVYGVELSKVKTLNQDIKTIERDRRYRSLLNDYKFN